MIVLNNNSAHRPRLNIFDGLRGHLLIGMLVAHLSFQDGLGWLRNIHHHRIIQLYDAEFFVLIAGLLVGYLWANVYTNNLRRRIFVMNRLWTIYKYYILSALPFFIYSLTTGSSMVQSGLGVLLMQMGGWYSDILPIYFFCFILILPFAIFYTLGRPSLMFAFSAIVYCAAQATDLKGFFGSSQTFVVFDIAAWQFLFFCAILIGRRSLELYNLIRQADPRLMGVVLLILAVLSVALRQNSFYPNPLILNESLIGNSPRMGLHPLFLIRIILIATGIAIIMIRQDMWLRPVHRLMHWYFNLSFIRNVGKYSIQMFVFHVYIMAFYKVAFTDVSTAEKSTFAVFWLVTFITVPNIWRHFKVKS